MASLTYTHDLLFGTYPRLFPPGWSLEVEVQFYILAPLLFGAYFAIEDRRVRLVAGLLVLVAACAIGWGPLATEPVRLQQYIDAVLSVFLVGDPTLRPSNP